MTRHVFPHRLSVRIVPLIALLVTASTVARAQQEPPPLRAEDPAGKPAEAVDVDRAAPILPPTVGGAFPTHLPMTPLSGADSSGVGTSPDTAQREDGEPPRNGTEPPDSGTEGDSGTSGGRGAATEHAPTAAGAAEPAVGQSIAAIVGETPRPLVLVFWSTKSVVCARYREALKALATALGDRAAIAVVVSGTDESREAVTKEFASMAGAVRVFLDPSLAAAERLGVRVAPTAFVVGADNVLRYHGPIDDDRRGRPREARPLLLPAAEAVIARRDVESGDVLPFGSAVR